MHRFYALIESWYMLVVVIGVAPLGRFSPRKVKLPSNPSAAHPICAAILAEYRDRLPSDFPLNGEIKAVSIKAMVPC